MKELSRFHLPVEKLIFSKMGNSSSRKLTSNHPGPLWIQWEKIVRKKRDHIVFIEADTNSTWTATALAEEAHQLSELMSGFARGTRVAFRLPNSAQWMALFLALQKRGLTATPLDANLPDEACMQMAQHLGCHALYLHGKIQLLEKSRKNRGDFCCIKVTSGTGGGLPKIVSCRAAHLIADGSNIIRTMGIRPDDRNLAIIPLGHSYGLGNFVMPLILQGTSLVCAARFVPRQLADWIEFHRVTVFPSVPAIFRVLASMPTGSQLDPLRLAISAGAPLTGEVAQAFHQRYGIKIHNFYGSSETGGICYDRQGTATLQGRSVGKPLTNVKVQVTRNMIQVSSAAVAKPTGRWRMPDLGEWNKQGELVLLGRSGREINIGGKKLHPSEIEQALRALTGISDALAWVEKSGEREILHVAVETRLALIVVQNGLAAKLPEWKLPKHYLLKRELPRTARGKIDVSALRKEWAARIK